MNQFFYTAIFRPSSGEILTQDGQTFAEHFADEGEMRKRAKQFEGLARSLGEVDPWVVYTGEVPLEVYLARMAVKPLPEELGAKDDTMEQIQAKQLAFAKRVQAAGDKVTKTASVLTAPEVDDTESKTQLPAWAIAQHEVEKAERHVIDAKEAHVALQKRADNLAEEAFASGASSLSEDAKIIKRQAAVRAQNEADQAQARLYHAEGDYSAKVNTYRILMDAEREGRKV